MLPLTKDVQCLSSHLKSKMEELMDKVAKDPKRKDTYSELMKVTLVSLVMFNRRRSGEVSRMKLTEYKPSNKTSGKSDYLAAQLP